MRRALIFGSVAVALVVAGCGLTNPYQATGPVTATHATAIHTTTAPVISTDADPGPERGGTIPAAATDSQNRLGKGGGSATPELALARYAGLYINWTANTVAEIQRHLAAISIGQARAQALQAAKSYGQDSTLQASRVANHGTVIAIAPGQGTDTGDWVVVTRETTSGQGDYAGLPATDHVTVAQVQHEAQGWVISAWTPEN